MNNINNLISEELGKMSQLFHYQRGRVISEQPAKDVTDLKTYPACVQNLSTIKISQTASEVFAKQTRGDFENYRFYNNGMYIGPNKKKGRYSCSGDDILIDGRKLTTTSKTYPKCVTNQLWGEPESNAKGLTYIRGGEMRTSDADYTGYFFYNNYQVTTPKKGLQSYKCSPDNRIISVFAPTKAPAGAPKADEVAKIKNISYAWCREKDGIINWPGSAVDKMKWADYLTKYSVTEPQLTQAKTACPNKLKPNVVSDTPRVNANKQKRQVVKQQVAAVNQEIQKSIGSTPTGSLSDAEIQQLITKFGGTA
jgi:hypothetical protein